MLLWLYDAEDAKEWGNPVEWHDTAPNWRYPPDLGPWRHPTGHR